MPIAVSCPECNTEYNVPDAAAGKQGNCKRCNAILFVPNRRKIDPERERAYAYAGDEPETTPTPQGAITINHRSLIRFFTIIVLLVATGITGAFIENNLEWRDSKAIRSENTALKSQIQAKEKEAYDATRKMNDIQNLINVTKQTADSQIKEANSIESQFGPYRNVFSSLIPEFKRTRATEVLRVTFICDANSVAIKDTEIINKSKLLQVPNNQ